MGEEELKIKIKKEMMDECKTKRRRSRLLANALGLNG
jgi:hypothetical protein